MSHSQFWIFISALLISVAGLVLCLTAVGWSAYPATALVGAGICLVGAVASLAGVNRWHRANLDAVVYLQQINAALASPDGVSNLPAVPGSTGPWRNLLSQTTACVCDLNDRLALAEHSQTTQALKDRRASLELARLSQVLDSMSEPILVVDGFQEIVFTNRAARELFQLPQSRDDLRRPMQELLSSAPLVEMLADFSTRRATTTRSQEISVVHDEENEEVYRATVSTVLQGEGEDRAQRGAVSILRDISDLKAIQKRNAEFVSAVSHEMKTPLAGIKAYVEMLADGDAEDEETQEEFLGVIDSQADRLSRLIENLLNLARIESGVVKVQKEPASLNELLDDVLDIVRPSAEDKRITLKSDLSPMYLEVFVDRDQMMQTAINLLSNAIKYTRPDGTVTLRSRMVDTQVQFEVEDTGVGLSPEDCENVFKKFYRVKKDQDMASGTGLGLPLAKYIVEDVHGGKLTVTSTPGVGSVFAVSLLESKHMTSASGARLEMLT